MVKTSMNFWAKLRLCTIAHDENVLNAMHPVYSSSELEFIQDRSIFSVN